MVIETNSPEETYRVGINAGELSQAGQVFTLTGDLGTGKTVFTQGLAKGLGIILTCIGLATSRKWKRSVSIIIWSAGACP